MLSVSVHARDKVRFYKRSGVQRDDLSRLQDAILSRAAASDSFRVDVPLVEAVLDQSHGNWEYRSNFRAVVEDRVLITVYLVA